MISCTEFILSYNELFAFLDRKYGRAEVDKLWDFLFKPTGKGIPLINFVRKDGIKDFEVVKQGLVAETDILRSGRRKQRREDFSISRTRSTPSSSLILTRISSSLAITE